MPPLNNLIKHKITASSCVKSVCIAFRNRYTKLLWLLRTSEPIYRIGRKIAGMILMLNCFIPNNNIKFPWGSFRDNCTKHILLNISRSSRRIDLTQKDPSESFFYLLIGTSCFHFYRLEKEETKGKLFQSEICQFWGIYAREIQLVTGEMCFPPNSARGIENFLLLRRSKI